MIKTINKKEKPKVFFECDICKTEFSSDEWIIANHPRSINAVLDLDIEKRSLPMERCPTCKMKCFSRKTDYGL